MPLRWALKREMKVKILSVLLAFFFVISFSACTERQKKEIKHIKSDIIGLKRRVTLYDDKGTPLKTWEGRFKIEIQGAFISFIDIKGKEVKISGTILVEEL